MTVSFTATCNSRVALGSVRVPCFERPKLRHFDEAAWNVGSIAAGVSNFDFRGPSAANWPEPCIHIK